MDIGNQPALQKKPSSKKKVFILLGLLVLLVAAGLLGYLYWAERESNKTLETQLSQAGKSSNSSSPTIAPAQAKYHATVGKFTLTLPSQRYIIVDLDGGFEGGPATRLSIGTISDKAEQTIVSPNHARVSVAAYPYADGELDSRKASEVGSPDATKLASVKVDGVDAEAYQIAGLFTDKKLLFTKNGLFYVITAGSADGTDVQTVFDEVVKGFKFD
jgi:hypothetical protein